MMSASDLRWRMWTAAVGAGMSVLLASAGAAAEEPPPRWLGSGLAINAVVGAQGLLTQSLGRAGTDLTSGGGAGFWIQAYGLKAPWNEANSFRLTLWGMLAGGGGGLGQAIGSEGAYGLRWSEPLVEPRANDPFTIPVDDGMDRPSETVWHALVARLGYAAHIRRDDAVRSSLVEVPRVEVGYQILGGFAVEARAHAGVVLAGELASIHGGRPLPPSMGWGGHVSVLGSLGLLVEAGLERIQPFEDDGLGPVDVADGRICVHSSRRRGATFGLCGDGRVERMSFPRPGGGASDAVTVYGGLLGGVGVY